MPDGNLMPAPAHEIDLSPDGILAMLMDHGGQALQFAIDDVGGDPKAIDRDVLIARYAWHLRERFAQSATVLRISIDSARELGKRDAHVEIIERRTAVDQALARASRVEGSPATERHPKPDLGAFTVGAALQLAKALELGVIAVLGKARRGEIPKLEPRTEAVYLANAAGRALANLFATHLRAARLGDALLVRKMEEAMLDGFHDVFASVAEAFTGRVN